MTQEVVSVAFNADGKMLAAQGGGPDWTLTVWLWEKSKVVGCVRSSNAAGSPISQVATHPLLLPAYPRLLPSFPRTLPISTPAPFTP